MLHCSNRLFVRFSRVHAADIEAGGLGDDGRRVRGRVSSR